MTDEQLIARIRGMTDLAKVDADREAYRATRDQLVEWIRELKQGARALVNSSMLFPIDGFQEQANAIASDVKQYEQDIKRIEPFITALDEQAEKLKAMR